MQYFQAIGEKDLEAELSDAVRAAQEEYERASREYADLMQTAKAAGLTTRDGRVAYDRALVAGRHRDEALIAYSQALRRFLDLVLRGKRK